MGPLRSGAQPPTNSPPASHSRAEAPLRRRPGGAPNARRPQHANCGRAPHSRLRHNTALVGFQKKSAPPISLHFFWKPCLLLPRQRCTTGRHGKKSDLHSGHFRAFPPPPINYPTHIRCFGAILAKNLAEQANPRASRTPEACYCGGRSYAHSRLHKAP